MHFTQNSSNKQTQSTHRKARLEPAIRDAQKLAQNVFPPWIAKHTFHTRSAWSFWIIFRLKLIVVRLVSGFPGLVRASPSLSPKMGSFAGVRSAIRVRHLGIGSAFWTRPGFYETVRLHLLAPFSGGLRHTAAFVVVVVVFTTTSRLAAPNLNWSITLHLIVYALVKWGFDPQGSTRQWLF